MFTTILEIIAKIRHILANMTLFNIELIVIFFLYEITWVTTILGVAIWFFDISLDTKEFIIWVAAGTLMDVLIPTPGQTYRSFKRLFILRFLAWIYKKRHFNSTSSIDALANYYQNLSKAVLQKYYNPKDDDVNQKLKVCIVHKIRDDKLPGEKRKAVCQELDLLKVDETISKFEAIFEAYKKELKNMEK